jgi:DUF971 family protein
MELYQLEAIEVRLIAGSQALEIDWKGGASSRYGAGQLRHACRCAECMRARIDGAFAPSDEVAIAGIDPIGSYAINVQFSDGHSRGIFPWSYLREIGTLA